MPEEAPIKTIEVTPYQPGPPIQRHHSSLIRHSDVKKGIINLVSMLCGTAVAVGIIYSEFTRRCEEKLVVGCTCNKLNRFF